MLTIGKPYILERNNKIRLLSNISINGSNNELYYEVDSKYKEYISYEISDSFLVCLLLYSMENGYDIKVEGYVSERLLYQIKEYFIPTISRNMSIYKSIHIYSKTINMKFNPSGVGTGLSCGVDSFYTILKNIHHTKESMMKITHLCFFNMGASGGKGGEKARTVYLNRMNHVEKVANFLGLSFFACDSNINEFLNQNHEMTHTFRTLSVPLAFQKLFSIYYFSSGFAAEKFRFDSFDSASFDIFTLPILSNDNTRFTLVGSEGYRTNKIKYISDFEIVQNELNVCINNKRMNDISNCGVCPKCKRTLLNLYSIGRLELFDKVFNLNKFMKKKNEYLTWCIIQHLRKKSDMDDLYAELKKNKKIRIYNYLYVPFYVIKKIFLRMIRKK